MVPLTGGKMAKRNKQVKRSMKLKGEKFQFGAIARYFSQTDRYWTRSQRGAEKSLVWQEEKLLMVDLIIPYCSILTVKGKPVLGDQVSNIPACADTDQVSECSMMHSNCRAVKPLSFFTLIVLLLVVLLFVDLLIVTSMFCLIY